MAQLWEITPKQPYQEEYDQSLDQLIRNQTITVEEIVIQMNQQSIYSNFMRILNCFDQKKEWNDKELQRLQRICFHFFQRPQWCIELISQMQSSVIQKIISISLKLNNRMEGQCISFFQVETFYSFVYYSLFQTAEHHEIQKVIQVLKQMKTIQSIQKGIQQVINDQSLTKKYEVIFNVLSKFTLQLRIEWLTFLFQKCFTFTEDSHQDEFKRCLLELTKKEYEIDMNIFYDIFNQTNIRLHQNVIIQLAKGVCQNSHSDQLLTMLFTLYSNRMYCTMTPFSSQWVLTRHIIYILRCIPFSTIVHLLSNGITMRLNSPIKKIKDSALVMMNEIDSFTKLRKSEWNYSFDTTIIFDGIEQAELFSDEQITKENIINETVLNNETLQTDESMIKEVHSKIEEINTSSKKSKETTEIHSTPTKPMHLIEWVEAFEELSSASTSYQEFELTMSIGSEIIRKSTKFISPYIEQIMDNILQLKNRFNMDQFEDWQINMLYELITNKDIKCKRKGSVVILEKIPLDRELVLKTMNKCGYFMEWIEPLRTYVMEWCYENKFEYNIKQAIEYLQEYGTVEMVNDWFVLYKNCRLNDRIVICLLSGLLHVISLLQTDLFIWYCCDQIKPIMSLLSDDTVNHPNKSIRLLASTLFQTINEIVSKEIKSESQKDILLFE